MQSVKQGGIKYQFLSLWYDQEFIRLRYQIPFFWIFGITGPGIEPRSPGPLKNTLIIIMPMGSGK